MFLKFFSFTFVKTEEYFSSSSAWIVRTCVETISDWISQKKHTPEDEHDGNGEILYKTPTKWRWPLLKTSLLRSRNVFFFGKNLSSLQRSILYWVPVLARQVTQKRDKRTFPWAFCKITLILLVQIIGDPYFFNHESLTLLNIYKIWWSDKISP